jgi:hypothetical protein
MGFVAKAGVWNMTSSDGLKPTAFDANSGYAMIQMRKINTTNNGYVLTEKFDLDGMLNGDSSEYTSFLIHSGYNWGLLDEYYLDIWGDGKIDVHRTNLLSPGTFVNNINLNQIVAPGTHNFTLEFNYYWQNKQLAIAINGATINGINFDMPMFNDTYEQIWTNNPTLKVYGDYHNNAVYTSGYVPDYNSWDSLLAQLIAWNVDERYLPWIWNIILIKLPLALGFLFGVIRIFSGS